MNQQNRHSSCHLCCKPFSLTRLPKLLRCSHTTCVPCLRDTCLTDDKKAVICLKCTKKTYLEPIANAEFSPLTCENGLITNYRFLMEEHSSATSKRFLMISDEEEEDQAMMMSFLADCEAPHCREKATGRCDGCGGAAFCNRCYNAHVACLPQSVKEKHTFGSVADSQSCPKHKLPRQLFCMSHHKAICATCSSLHHRDCADVRELSTVVQTLKPQITERQEKMLDLFKIALSSCYELRNEMKEIDLETEQTISNLLEKTLQCVQDTYQTVYQVQSAAIQRKLELDHAYRCLSVEAGSFAEEVEEIKNLFEKSANPDPALVARHAPAEQPQIHTKIPTGKTVTAELVFDVKHDLKQFWERRGAAKIPAMFLLSREQEAREKAKQDSKDFLKSLYNTGGNHHSSPSATRSSPAANNTSSFHQTNVTIHTKTIPAKIHTKFGKSQGTDDNSFNHIRGFASLPNGNIAVCDMNNHRIQILDPTALAASKKNSYSHQHEHGVSKNEILPGKFVTFIPISTSQDKTQSQVYPAFPTLVCTLRNGLLFVLDNENRCGYFVDAMVDLQQRNVPKKNFLGGGGKKNKELHQGETLENTNINSSSSNKVGDGSLWRYPFSWVRPSGICLLPETNEVAIIDESRHVVSILDKTLQYVVREFDGVDVVHFSLNDSSIRRERHQIGGEFAVSNDGVHQDMIHRIDAPKAICVIPSKCPWGEDLTSLIESKDEDILEFLALSTNNSPSKGAINSAATSSRDKNLANEEEIRFLWKKRNEQRDRQVHAEIVGEFNETAYTYTVNDKRHHSLIAVCSETFVSILDAQTGAFVRFIGGDASRKRVISRPWGICCSDDGRRLAIVDGVQSCLYIARVGNGDIIAKIVQNQGEEENTHDNNASSATSSSSNLLRPASESSQQRNRAFTLEQKQQLVLKASTFYPQNILTIPLDGRIVVTDIVSHSVNVMELVL